MKPIWLVVISVLVTGGLVGGGTYYLVNTRASSDKDAMKVQIDELSKKYDEVKAELASDDSAVANKITSTSDSATQPQITTSTDATSDLSTYNNDDLGITLKYPKNWTYGKFDQTAGTVTFNDTEDHWELNITAKNTTQSLSDAAKAKIMELGGGASGGSGVTNTDTTIGGVVAKKITVPAEGSGKEIFYLVVKNNKLFTISPFVEDTTSNQIISSFTFTK
ncbi:MAG: PsbP-related protein [Patescibacteria group bacterium]